MPLQVKDGGNWRNITQVHVKDGGIWRNIKEAWIKEAGTWRKIFNSVSPGQFVFIPITDSLGNNTNTIYFSNDGITWTPKTISITDRLQSMAYDSANNRMIVQGTTNTSISINGGATWSNGGALNTSHAIRDIVYANGVYSGVGGTSTTGPFGVYSNNNGSSWTTTNLPYPGSTSRQWNSIAFGQGKFVSVSAGRGATRTNVAGYSNDGLNWTASTMPYTQWFNNVRYSNNRFIATSNSVNPGVNGIAYSADGINWVESTRPPYSEWPGQGTPVFGNNRWLVLATTGVYMVACYSDDNGTTFSMIPGNTITNLFYGSVNAVAYGKGKFVLMVAGITTPGYSETNQILISENGLTWSHYQVNFKTGGGKLYFLPI